MGKDKKQLTDWETIKEEYRIGRFSIRAIARKHGITHTAINKKRKKEGWKQDLSHKVRSAVREKLVSKKAKEIVSKQEESGNTTDELDEDKLTEDETIEYAALADLAFLNMWDKRFHDTLKAVSKLKKDILDNNYTSKHDENNLPVKLPLSPTTKATLLNAITQAETRVYNDMRKNMAMDNGGGDDPQNEGLTAYPSGPMSIAQWEREIKEADAKRKETNDIGN